MEKYFNSNKNYFIAVATASNNVGAASLKEKEMVARFELFLSFIIEMKTNSINVQKGNFSYSVLLLMSGVLVN